MVSVNPKPKPLSKRIYKDLRVFGTAYAMMFVVLLYYLLFHYKPMLGAVIAFKNYVPRRGIWGSEWVGFQNFISFFGSQFFGRLIRNTLTISLSGLLFSFPAAILFALSINEVHHSGFKRTVQTIAYMPHFISLIVVCSMIRLFVDSRGFIVQIMEMFGHPGGKNLLGINSMFVPIYVVSEIWQQTGWNCIIYLAALNAIDTELYEAARLDGAGRLKQTVHVTLPGIMRTIILLLILRIGSMMSVGHEKIILLYSEQTYEVADVISSYVFRRGMINGDYSFSTAVGLFNSTINFTLVVLANRLSNAMTGYGIW